MFRVVDIALLVVVIGLGCRMDGNGRADGREDSGSGNTVDASNNGVRLDASEQRADGSKDTGGKSEDSGEDFVTNWDVIESGTKNDLTAIWGSSASDIWVVGIEQNDTINDNNSFILHYDGRSWSRVATPGKNDLSDVWGTADDDIWAVGCTTWNNSGRKYDRGVILHYDGNDWTEALSETAFSDVRYCLNAVWGSSSTDVYALGEDRDQVSWRAGFVLHWDGYEWREVENDFDEYGHGDIWGASADDVFIYIWGISTGRVSQKNERLIHYDGKTWTHIDRYDYNLGSSGAVWCSSATEVFLANDDAMDYYDGQSFSNLLNVDSSNPSDSWYRHASFTGIWGFSANDVYAVGYQTTYPPSPSGGTMPWISGTYIYHFNGSSWSAYDLFDLTVELRGIWGASPNDIWVVGDQGTILRLRLSRAVARTASAASETSAAT